METVKLSLEGSWALLYMGLILGAGLPIAFALGVRMLAGTTAEAGGRAPGPLARLGSGVCFGIALLGVVTGLMIIVAAGIGKVVTFEKVYPSLVDKE
ncbi:MAG: hypothetical protein ACRCYQ_05490 [Nocardioides sp.]